MRVISVVGSEISEEISDTFNTCNLTDAAQEDDTDIFEQRLNSTCEVVKKECVKPVDVCDDFEKCSAAFSHHFNPYLSFLILLCTLYPEFFI